MSEAPANARRVRRARDGRLELRIPREEREVLRTLPAQLREVLGSSDPALRRVFPPAHADDRELDAQYQELVHDDLLAQRLRAADTMAATIDARRLDGDQALAWLSALNDLRLILGTKLDVREDMTPDDVPGDDPLAPGFALYYYLGFLEEQVVEALAESLPA